MRSAVAFGNSGMLLSLLLLDRVCGRALTNIIPQSLEWASCHLHVLSGVLRSAFSQIFLLVDLSIENDDGEIVKLSDRFLVEWKKMYLRFALSTAFS